jgi:ribosomal protein S18 acetylase RimI-like enzyme
MKSGEGVRIERWHTDSPRIETDLAMLAEILHACVHAGATVHFVLPFSIDEAIAFWRDKVLPSVDAGSCCLFVARVGERIVGTVQLDISTPPNQPHRAEARKLLVHPDARRHGIARRLMNALEDEARRARRSLITLDTKTGDFAEALYRSMGYITIGTIPNYSLSPDSSSLDAATFMYKELASYPSAR